MGLGIPGMLVLSICAMKLKRLHGANLELMGTREKPQSHIRYRLYLTAQCPNCAL